MKPEEMVIYFHLCGYRVPDLNENDNRLNLNGNNWNEFNNNRYSFGIALAQDINSMPITYNKLYNQIISLGNLTLAWRMARKGKTLKKYVLEFEEDLQKNLLALHIELKENTYYPKPLTAFVIRDPKTRLIHKSDFRDRIVHHALVRILEPLFDKTFIYDSYANRIDKGTLNAIERFNQFVRKVSRNGSQKGWFNNNQIKGYCLKADIKHYFQTVDHSILLSIIKNKINDIDTINLIERIVKANFKNQRERETQREINYKGMPIGNLTSQFFANLYLNELDQFVKHELKAKYYIRYVDDFIILDSSKEQLENYKMQIIQFLKDKLKLDLHPDKSKIIPLARGIDFVGFRNFWKHTLLRKRNIRTMQKKIHLYKKEKISFSTTYESYQGWQAYAKWANTHKLKEKIKKEIISNLLDKI